MAGKETSVSKAVKGRRGGWEDLCGVAASGQSMMEGCSEWEASPSKALMRGGSPCALSYNQDHSSFCAHLHETMGHQVWKQKQLRSHLLVVNLMD